MLSFWIAAGAITLMVAAVLANAVVRGGRREVGSRAASDVEV